MVYGGLLVNFFEVVAHLFREQILHEFVGLAKKPVVKGHGPNRFRKPGEHPKNPESIQKDGLVQ